MDMRVPPERNRGTQPGTTQWSRILLAGETDHPESRRALAGLCQTYWRPVYAYIRRGGHEPDDARDLTQGFFLDFLERRFFKAANPDRGRFRSFLRACVDHYLGNERRRQAALKRGPGVVLPEFNFEDAERAWAHDPRGAETPERLYERKWAHAALQKALERVRLDAERSGQFERFSVLCLFLTGEPCEPSRQEAARQLSMTEGAFKVALHRLRRQFGVSLRQEIESTVADPSDVDAELRYIMTTLGT